MEIIIISMCFFTFPLILGKLFYANKSTDQWLTVWYIKNKDHIFNNYKYTNSIIDGKLADPRFYYSLLGYIAKKENINIIGYYLNLVFHIAPYIILVYIIHEKLYLDIKESIVISFVFSLSPVLYPLTARLNSIKARTFGKFLAVVCLFSVYYLIEEFNLLLYTFIVILSLLTIASSAMAAQYLIYIIMVLAIAYLSVEIFLIIPISLAIAFIIPNLGIKDVIIFKYHHYKWYYNMLEKTFQASRKNIFQDLKFWKINKSNITNNIIVLVLSGCPVLVSLPFIEYTNIVEISIVKFSLIIILGTFTIIVITGIKPLTIFGQAERYLEYSIPFVAVIYSVSNLNQFIYIILSINMLVILFTIQYLIKYNNCHKCNNVENKEENEMISIVNKICNNEQFNIKLLCFPLKYGFKLDSVLKGNYKIYLEWFYGHDGLKYMENDSLMYTIPFPNFEFYSEKYGINTIILNKHEYYNIYSDKQYSLDKYNKLYENNKYAILYI